MRATAQLVCAVGALIACTTDARAPSPSRAHTPLDTTALGAEATAVYRTWQAYLVSKAGRYSARAGEPSPHWVRSEQQHWPVYDLAGFYLPDGAVPEIVGVEQVGDEYRVTTRFHASDQDARRGMGWTPLTVTVYATRDSGEWRLANALPRHTATWRRDTVGPITYAFARDYPYNRSRARRAVAFADSVAEAFDVPRLAALTYYLAASADEVYGIMGLASDVTFGGAGGAAQPVNRMLFSGDPAVGEEYRHELAHLLLAPLCCARTSYVVSEGVATWLGGTTGMDYATSVRGLAAFLASRPAVSLDSLLSGALPAAQVYPAGAVLTHMVHEQGGVAAVKRLMSGGRTPTELRATLEQELQRPWSVIVRDWRAWVMRFATAADS